MYVYINSEPGLYTVGHYDPDGKWVPESDHSKSEVAAARVNYLNGGIGDRLAKAEEAARSAANIASCLANGILPD